MDTSDPLLPPPIRLAAELHRRYPSAWKRFDAARATRSPRLKPTPVPWLTFDEALSALREIRDKEPLSDAALPIETVMDLFMCATWRVTQGVYRFDDELLALLAATPLDIALPSSLLSRLPEWGVYIETPGFHHHRKSIVGMLAAIVEGPRGLALALSLFPATITSFKDDVDRIQLDLNDMSLRKRLYRDTEKHQPYFESFRDSAREIFNHLPEAQLQEVQQIIDGTATNMTREFDALRKELVDTVISEIVPFISLLLYLCTDSPDLDRPLLPKGTATKRGIRFFTPSQPQVHTVGSRIGAKFRQARIAYEEAERAGLARGVRPHPRIAHWNRYWTGSRKSEQGVIFRWLPPVYVNANLAAAPSKDLVVRPVT